MSAHLKITTCELHPASGLCGASSSATPQVVVQGEEGNKFYIVAGGKLEAVVTGVGVVPPRDGTEQKKALSQVVPLRVPSLG